MIAKRKSSFIYFLILSAGLSAPAFCQTSEPEVPPETPIYECIVDQAQVQFIQPYVDAHGNSRYFANWNATGQPLHPETIAQVIVTYPRQRPTNRTTGYPPHPDGTEFKGAIWAFGRSRLMMNPPGSEDYLPIYRGYQYSGERMDCVKRVPDPAGYTAPTGVLERYSDETSLRTVNLYNEEYKAHSVFVRFSNGVAVGIRRDVDYGTDCGSTMWQLCQNSACPKFMVCEAPMPYSNAPCEACGMLGRDSTREDFGLYQYQTVNMIPSLNPPGKWEDTTVQNTGVVGNAGTTAQVITNGGTPYMWAYLFQTVAKSDAEYNPPGGTVPQYNEGLYFEIIDQFKIYKGPNTTGGNKRYFATFRIRKWLLWDFSVSGLFSYVGDWFACDPKADMNHDGCHDTADLFNFIGVWFRRGQ